MEDYQTINAEYASYFKNVSPARICIEVALPGNRIFEMDILACKQKFTTLHVESISHWAPAMIGPYSQAIVLDDKALLAGMIGLEPFKMELTESYEEQLQLAELHLEKIQQCLKIENTYDYAFLIRYNSIDAEISERDDIECDVTCSHLPKYAKTEL